MAVLRSKVVAEIANQAQAVIDAQKIPGFVYDQKSLADTQSLLNRFNMLGRYISGVESGKYGIRISAGDIDILAPPDMAPAEYDADIYPAAELGAVIVPIIYALIAGATLIAGIWGAAKILENDAERQRETNAGRLIEADKEMLKQPEPTRRAWADFRNKMKTTAQEVGVLSKIFGSETAGKIGAGLGAGLLLVAAVFALGQWRRG